VVKATIPSGASARRHSLKSPTNRAGSRCPTTASVVITLKNPSSKCKRIRVQIKRMPGKLVRTRVGWELVDGELVFEGCMGQGIGIVSRSDVQDAPLPKTMGNQPIGLLGVLPGQESFE